MPNAFKPISHGVTGFICGTEGSLIPQAVHAFEICETHRLFATVDVYNDASGSKIHINHGLHRRRISQDLALLRFKESWKDLAWAVRLCSHYCNAGHMWNCCPTLLKAAEGFEAQWANSSQNVGRYAAEPHCSQIIISGLFQLELYWELQPVKVVC